MSRWNHIISTSIPTWSYLPINVCQCAAIEPVYPFLNHYIQYISPWLPLISSKNSSLAKAHRSTPHGIAPPSNDHRGYRSFLRGIGTTQQTRLAPSFRCCTRRSRMCKWHQPVVGYRIGTGSSTQYTRSVLGHLLEHRCWVLVWGYHCWRSQLVVEKMKEWLAGKRSVWLLM